MRGTGAGIASLVDGLGGRGGGAPRRDSPSRQPQRGLRSGSSRRCRCPWKTATARSVPRSPRSLPTSWRAVTRRSRVHAALRRHRRGRRGRAAYRPRGTGGEPRRPAVRQREALGVAAERIREFHRRQRESDWSSTDAHGNTLGQRITPLSRVGVYVPGGKASYPSSVLMNAIPARVAGVREIIMVAPTPAASATRWYSPRRPWPGSTPCTAWAVRRPWPPWPTARPACRASTRLSAPVTATWPRPSARFSAASAST
jgi:hypothetical protein